MNELSLFTGAGGGLLGSYLLGWRPVGYVEWNEYCQRVIAARIADGYLPVAPIFTDVREFVQSGAAEQYRGIADVVSAGFPCQPFSVAGKRAGADDDRDMWPAALDVIRIVRPKHVLLENSPRLAVCGYAAVVIAGLAALGYVGSNGVLSAAAEGADHLRERIWIAAHADGDGLQERVHERGAGAAPRGSEFSRGQDHGIIASPQDANTDGWQRPLGRQAGRIGRVRQPIQRNGDWPITSEPVLGRGEDGVAHRLDRLKAIGNGQVPAVVARAWELLS